MISQQDRAILRELAMEKAAAAADPQNKENIRLWTAANDLRMEKPPIYINEVCWNEMNVDDELTLRTEDPRCRSLEQELRRELYAWRHLRGNMVISDTMDVPTTVTGMDFGLAEKVDIVETDHTSDVVSREFHIQIQGEEDIEKIKDPVVRVDEKASAEALELAHDLFDGILTIIPCGFRGMWFTPWDNLIRLTGVEACMVDLIDRPEYIDALVARYVDASLSLLDQLDALGLWASNNNNTRVGSGGYGYCSALPDPQGLDSGASPKQLWGCGNAQIFSDVSPDMHWDFSLQHEMRWLTRFGITYYGCCEPLDRKLGILERIPNLRKISMSPWANLDNAREKAGDRYVLSCKPNPAVFAGDRFDEDYARADILKILEATKGCHLELILKDISTVRYRPRDLWRWADIARETIDDFYGG